jgi:hypothetical protein
MHHVYGEGEGFGEWAGSRADYAAIAYLLHRKATPIPRVLSRERTNHRRQTHKG